MNRFRYPDIILYGRQEDTLAGFSSNDKVITKGVNYGIENLERELIGPKLFENSYYLVKP